MRNRTWPTSKTAPSRYSRLSSSPFTWARISTTRKPATRPENSSGRGTSAAASSTTPTWGGGGAAVAAGGNAGRDHQNAPAATSAAIAPAATMGPIQVRAIIDPLPSLSGASLQYCFALRHLVLVAFDGYFRRFYRPLRSFRAQIAESA